MSSVKLGFIREELKINIQVVNITTFKKKSLENRNKNNMIGAYYTSMSLDLCLRDE